MIWHVVIISQKENIQSRERKAVSDMENSLKKIAEYYGYAVQSSQLVEECAELIQAINKYRRAENPEEYREYFKNIIEEIADVEIMIEQVKYLLQILDDEVEAVKLFKVNRTLERMTGKGM